MDPHGAAGYLRAFGTTIAAWYVTALAGPLAVHADGDDGPLFGGTPIVERVDEFGGDGFDFLVTVHTAVYYGPDAVLPDALELVELNEGHSYLIYLLHNHGETAVDLFGLTNPDAITIPVAGILPADIVQDESFDPDDLVHPSVWFFGIDLISFAWDESYGLLGPGNWSIVFYGSKGWQDVTSWVGDSSDFPLDFGLLLGPSEEVNLPEDPDDCPGDVNGDGWVDGLDMGAVTACLGQEVEEGDPCFPTDVNEDGVVDALDLGFVSARFGECPVAGCADDPGVCDDGVDCTNDVCEDGTCLYTPSDANCADDGLFCNGSEGCDAVEGCLSSGDPCEPGTFCNEDTDTCDECADDDDCDDDVDCTDDACENGTCVYVAGDANCEDDGAFCNGEEQCHADEGCISTGDPCNRGTFCNEYAQRCIPIPAGVALNEIRVDQIGGDTDEYFELFGPPNMKLDGLTYVVIGDGVGGSGEIEAVVDLSGEEVPSGGFFLAAEATFTLNGITPDMITNLNFENNDNVTHLLVSEFIGSNGDDLDLDDDGILDIEPWSAVLGCIGLVAANNSGDRIYCNTTVGPFMPARVYKCPDGIGHWKIGLLDDLTFDTPGAPNVCPPPVCGDGICNGDGEDCFSCPDDCRCKGPECNSACCGNGICEGDELADNCTIDCGVCTANADCDNQNLCSSGLCSEGVCFSTPVDCDDGDACTADSCVPSSGCVHDSIDCDDQNACTTDSCDSATGCANDPVDCDDGDECTLDSCDPASGCVSEPIDCDDANPCTTDGCNPANGLCVNEPISSCCGNAFCEQGEDSCTCPIDCGEPPVIETNCADGIDEDCDELTDCDDVDCELDPICICVVDGECVEGEDCVNCPEDCFAGGGTCGDGICEGDGEDCFTCMADCLCTPTPDTCWGCCGDGVCAPVLESAASCPVDCDPEFEPPSSCCGDGSCEGSEDAVNCAVDCAG